jgi:hypothetical protein
MNTNECYNMEYDDAYRVKKDRVPNGRGDAMSSFYNHERAWMPVPVVPGSRRYGRYWPDDCQHRPDEYIGSVIALRWKNDGTYGADEIKIDVYVHSADNGRSQHVCIRTGTAGDYASAGTLVDFLGTTAVHGNKDVVYRAARMIIDEMMEVRATRRQV